jgi:hypothetical protein
MAVTLSDGQRERALRKGWQAKRRSELQKHESSPGERTIDRRLLSLDEGAFGAIYRGIIGFVTVPAMQLLLGSNSPHWAIVPFLLLVLLLLRIFPAIARKVIPFSAQLKEAWSVRRRTAKLYDSYQWRKVLWIGAGLALYIVVSGDSPSEHVALSAVCLIAGAVAMMKWQAILSDSRYPKPVARKIKRSV